MLYLVLWEILSYVTRSKYASCTWLLQSSQKIDYICYASNVSSFCLTFEWEGAVYTTGNGTDCPDVDAGGTALKVQL